MSFTNYVDDGYVIDDLRVLVREVGKVEVQWIPETVAPANFTPRLVKSIKYWRNNLPDLVKSMGSDVALIQEFRTEVRLKENHQIAVEGVLTDDRGREYVAPVYDF